VPAHRLDFLVPRFIELHLPVGVRGLLVAAILAAAMSSLDSALNSLSAATMRDFLARRVAPERQLLASRLCTLFWGLVITAVGLHAGELAPSVVEAINRVGALFYGPLLAAFVCGICDARARGAAVRCGVAAGLAANLLLWALLGPDLFWMWWNVSGLLVAAAVTVLLSRLLPATVAATPELRWQRSAWSSLPRGSVALLTGWTIATAALLGLFGSR
jgi:Na+/proline symporter